MNEVEALAWAIHDLPLSELERLTGVSARSWSRARQTLAKPSPDVRQTLAKPSKASRGAPSSKRSPQPPTGVTPQGVEAKRGSKFVPEFWQPSPKHAEQAKGLGVDLQAQVEKFRDHEFKNPIRDFDRAFSRWLRTAQEIAARRPQKAPGLVEHEQMKPEKVELPSWATKRMKAVP